MRSSAVAFLDPVSDFGPCVMRGKDGRMTYVGAAEVILENREDIDRNPDHNGNRPVVRGARRSTTLREMWARGVITKRMHDAANRFLDDLSLANGGGGCAIGGGIRIPAGPRTGFPETQANAITRVMAVMVRLGINTDTVFWWVLIGNKSTVEFDRRFRLREGTGAGWLRESLDGLDEHYNPGCA